jgi:acetolactate synthase-1/2/3 large subunit
MIRLADYVAQTLVRHGCDRVFLITGGLAMHLNDAIGKCPGLAYTCCHHEQSCAMAAEGYARIRNRPAVVQITGGPGGINTLNGVFGAYTDSIPMLILSGQAKRETCLSTYDLPGLRQLGDQEVEIVPMVRGITKYAVFVRDPLTIRRELEKAIYLSTHGRPGPCWLDIPVDVQSAMIDENALEAYDPAADVPADDPARLRALCAKTLDRIRKAERNSSGGRGRSFRAGGLAFGHPGHARLDRAGCVADRSSAQLRPARNGRRPAGKFRRAELRPDPRARLAPEHPAGEL